MATPVQRKSQALVETQGFVTRIERAGHTVKQTHSDQDRCFVAVPFENWCKRKAFGIQLQLVMNHKAMDSVRMVWEDSNQRHGH